MPGTGSGALADAPLFSDRVRRDSSPGGAGELAWQFLDRVDDPVFDRVRRLLNAWYERYPVAHRAMLRGNLAGREAEQSNAAWFELYLHELHRALGFDVVVEPELRNVAGKPDFLVAWQGAPCLLEATIVGGGTDGGRRGRVADVERALDRINNPDFRLWLHIDAESEQSPPMRGARRRIAGWLDGLDWERERGRLDSSDGDVQLPKLEVEAGEWRLSLRAHARAPKWRGVPGAMVGVGPAEGGVFNHGETLRDRLGSKADQCRGSTVPVIVAIRLDGMAMGDDDVQVALMGEAIGRVDPQSPTRITTTGRHGAGLFRAASGRWRNRHIAGVLVWDTELRPWSITRQAPRLWLHPNPDLAVPHDLPWARVSLDGRPHAHIPGAFDPAATFDLPDAHLFSDAIDWPGRPFEQHPIA